MTEIPWPQAAMDAIATAVLVEVNGGELEHISTVYSEEGQAIVVLDALAKAGFDVRQLPRAVDAENERLRERLTAATEVIGMAAMSGSYEMDMLERLWDAAERWLEATQSGRQP